MNLAVISAPDGHRQLEMAVCEQEYTLAPAPRESYPNYSATHLAALLLYHHRRISQRSLSLATNHAQYVVRSERVAFVRFRCTSWHEPSGKLTVP